MLPFFTFCATFIHFWKKHETRYIREAIEAMGRAIGIDLGTVYSCVGIYKNGTVEILTNEQGNRVTPSMVAFNATVRLVGDAANFQITKNPKNTIYGKNCECWNNRRTKFYSQMPNDSSAVNSETSRSTTQTAGLSKSSTKEEDRNSKFRSRTKTNFLVQKKSAQSF